MKRSRVRVQPCVIFHGEHVIHATPMRAQRNAAICGGKYHAHETTVPTIYGRLRKLAGKD